MTDKNGLPIQADDKVAVTGTVVSTNDDRVEVVLDNGARILVHPARVEKVILP